MGSRQFTIWFSSSPPTSKVEWTLEERYISRGFIAVLLYSVTLLSVKNNFLPKDQDVILHDADSVPWCQFTYCFLLVIFTILQTAIRANIICFYSSTDVQHISFRWRKTWSCCISFISTFFTPHDSCQVCEKYVLLVNLSCVHSTLYWLDHSEAVYHSE